MSDYEVPRVRQQPAAKSSERMLAAASMICAALLLALLALAMLDGWMHPPA